ncbi:MAG: hypothetical protein A4E28_02618 [Methanocella sp. PtaU1.Bin125]|nr:MAG: hypothetical protein A4E28_02618 [Methanocella sp. PtaU1.Bin125]
MVASMHLTTMSLKKSFAFSVSLPVIAVPAIFLSMALSLADTSIAISLTISSALSAAIW